MSDQAQQPDTTPGIFCWNELATRDPAASTKFYTQLLGWTAETMSMGPGMEYTFFKIAGQNAGGMLRLPLEVGNAPNAWLGYVTVTDLAAAVAKAKSLGAKVCKDITALPMGRFAIITDPTGAVLGLWEFTKQG